MNRLLSKNDSAQISANHVINREFFYDFIKICTFKKNYHVKLNMRLWLIKYYEYRIKTETTNHVWSSNIDGNPENHGNASANFGFGLFSFLF